MLPIAVSPPQLPPQTLMQGKVQLCLTQAAPVGLSVGTMVPEMATTALSLPALPQLIPPPVRLRVEVLSVPLQ